MKLKELKMKKSENKEFFCWEAKLNSMINNKNNRKHNNLTFLSCFLIDFNRF